MGIKKQTVFGFLLFISVVSAGLLNVSNVLEATPDEVLDLYLEQAVKPGDFEATSKNVGVFKEQKINHFDLQDKRTFSHRYWQFDDHFDHRNGTVQVYFCGEAPCQGLPAEHSFAGVIAKTFKSRLYVIEHRYYGESQPFPDLWSVDNLRYLTVEQALADVAYFIDVKNKEIMKEFGFKPKWYTVGGSYAGAKSAWMRTLYPNLVETSLASSAVVHAIADYQQYDEQIRRSLLLSSKDCADYVREVSTFAQHMVLHSEKTRNQIKKIFKGEGLGDVQFLAYIADMPSEFVQYGQRTDLCDAIKAKDFKEAFKKFLKFMDDHNQLGDKEDLLAWVQDQKVDFTKGDRQWTWQTCTQLGYFQTAHIGNPERSTLIDLEFYKQQCADTFEQPIWLDTDITNTMLEGAQNQGTKIVFNNGIEDPFQWASLHKPNNDFQVMHEIDCVDCAHCVDLYLPKPTDAPSLKAARRSTIRHMAKWLDLEQ